MAVLTFALAAVTLSSTPLPPTDWVKVFEGTGRDGWVSSVQGMGPDDFIVGGGWGMTTVTAAGSRQEPTSGRAILGLFLEGPDSVFAMGSDELILHFKGTKWIEEHAGPKPKRPGKDADMLDLAFFLDARPDSPLVAHGPRLALVRQPDGGWILPTQTEQRNLVLVGELGPTSLPTPPHCHKAGWFWLGKNRGWFACHERQSYLFDGGVLVPKGKIPGPCDRSTNSVALTNGELFAACSGATLWRTAGTKWLQIAKPKGVKEINRISVAANCVFVAGPKAVWRRCGL